MLEGILVSMGMLPFKSMCRIQGSVPLTIFLLQTFDMCAKSVDKKRRLMFGNNSAHPAHGILVDGVVWLKLPILLLGKMGYCCTLTGDTDQNNENQRTMNDSIQL
mmetsp:Transcript_12136/g.17441  ORF Transcript_12136/g.17441 Transcript_12136/m.17441 type:complete len:105 (+) Transcript_12136:387-701(+)